MKDKIVKKLDEIAQLLHDGYSCYKNHVENVKQPALKELFIHLSQQRLKMENEIKKEIELAGEKPSEGGTITGTVHKFYENLKSIITQGDPLAITKEIKRGENMLLEEYKSAISCHLTNELKEILIRQFNQVEDELKEADNTAIKAVAKS